MLQTTTNPKGPGREKERWKDKNTDHISNEDNTTDSKWKRKSCDNKHSNGYKPKSVDKSNVECFRCHKYDHYKFECNTNLNRNRGVKSNFIEK